ncbi:MAG TPA: DUF87 domain-containing protein [Blastocatellia bacterium]|nr:DUF87 domain-containing protein [Blastocatellia bacterium]
MRGIKLMQWFFKRRLRRESRRAIAELTSGARHQQETVAGELARLGQTEGAAIELGTTGWGQAVRLPVREIANHSLIVGASGSGKSFLALSLICQLLEQLAALLAVTFGILDAKGELFERALAYVYAYLYRLRPEDRERFKRRIVTIDFSSPAAITPYNVLAPQRHLADEIMVANRIDTISEQFSGLSEMSVRMKMILKFFLLLMIEFKLPLPLFETLCADPALLRGLVERSSNLQVRDCFLHRFDDESKATLLALCQRLESLFISESVRLSLSATTAPDFAALQDSGAMTGRMTKPQHNPFEPAKPMSESEELKSRLKEITKLPDRAAYCWLKAFADKAVKIQTPLVPQPHELVGCNQQELADFMKSEPIGQGVSRDEIKKLVAERQQELRRLVRPAARQNVSSAEPEPRKSGKSTLGKALEETCAKKKDKQ